MAQSNQQTLPANSVIEALKGGFELTTRRAWLLIIPIMMDIYLWIGPRLRVSDVMRSFYDELLAQVPSDSALLPTDVIAAFYDLLEQFNLFVLLSVPMVGVPSLMRNFAGEQVPIETTDVVISSLNQIVVLALAFILVGLVSSGVLYALIAGALNEETSNIQMLARLPMQVVRLIGFGILAYIVLLGLIFGLVLVASFAGVVYLPLAPIVLIGGSVVVIWALVFASFGPHAVMMQDMSPWRAIPQSVRFIRAHMGLTLPLILIVWFTNSILDDLWLAADGGNWFTLISIAGHAFVATSLLAATFIFYKEHALTPAEAA